MLSISLEEFLTWKKKQLSKGGDQQSFTVLLDCLGGISASDLNLMSINPEGKIHLKKKLEFLESVWDDHLFKSCPIQYLCGITFWRDLKLKVTNKVLIPRPETELIVDIVFNIFRRKSEKLFFAELGTGSGAISIALALAYPSSDGVATDIDQDALEIATKNFINSSKQSNLKFYCGNWWSPLESFKGKLDLAISNPPYIPKDIYEKLPKEVKNFEPKVALLGGEDGLKHIREIIQKAPLFLKEKGWLILENHFDQGEKVKQLLLKNQFTSIEIVKDLSGIGRFTIGRYK
ncbi:peptide chain release factor N(5)-glutamine methyltransferase [Prochlorococcus marinus XMU1414]|uniref:Peptide chain release factor N(5)-glutamine methyltransferase n=1 Tax=Prochlorococcus marinus XMU1424 TaxID=2774497 RepID=A0A9D9G465_PROMR|nr:peptide chain release factor N(5)-glutamine methyltransferase [Prochlorococcus marinus]MBO8227619.1 peptide chain release factor N(5)-glutamine methyltransferase [Prochlorococcus marinus XMU1414]MBW3045133.1 peptide chain release factor N(5)-glutamine methyltransferase [Prochlorococcus marinus str. MU1414]MCR8532602.1 peptide chain release factor N(5)-glutamine methyltransferase [Prochlorococcus marinus XMU1420]MCR8536573.1 peptide chain release factor N(5)-glutamine methyltransferase [Proch